MICINTIDNQIAHSMRKEIRNLKMLKISKPGANRLDLELSGVLDAEAMRAALDELLEKSEGITHGKMLYRILDFEMPTMGALAVEFQQMPKLFSLIGKFDKCAVLSDTAWLRTAADIEGALIPSLEVKSFSLSAAKAAEDWLNDSMEEEEENFPV
ncbi:SpoIIAA family protein [Roseobacter weihaiensis]|uniref:STAS/SEC14 domain-containing protein n=1 Tax=Roseobacter weihaiensis TaxID=2763262 RepID=UPI001D0B1653|nr:STAS/SEC14 domain-containing protein [Roseobacter sp. H9]